ncbi:hypothetical protein EI42_06474, partial [Thermosporothrix hazakensis]
MLFPYCLFQLLKRQQESRTREGTFLLMGKQAVQARAQPAQALDFDTV